MKFGSWTYDGFKVNFMLQQEDGGDISEFIPNGEWKLLGKLGWVIRELPSDAKPFLLFSLVLTALLYRNIYHLFIHFFINSLNHLQS